MAYNKNAKFGTSENSAVVHVQTQDRGNEIIALCDENNWRVMVGIEPDKPEDISDVEKLLNPPLPIKVISIGRNEPCLCGSGKKYKQCCLK